MSLSVQAIVLVRMAEYLERARWSESGELTAINSLSSIGRAHRTFRVAR